MVKKWVPMLGNGHGGVIDGVYQTPGKRSPDWDCGVLYEGEFNRWIVDGVIHKLSGLGVPFFNVCPELLDVSLGERARRVNAFYNKNKSSYYVSIHANGGGGNGWEIFTSPGITESDKLADKFGKAFQRDLPNHKGRIDMIDGYLDKEANFYVLRETVSPAILIEVGFMDQIDDYKKLWDSEFRDKIIESITNTIVEIRCNGFD